MKRLNRFLGALAAALLLWAAPAGAVVQKIGYQGTLRQSGVALTGSHALVFRVYGQLAGGAPLWTSAAMNVNFTSGRFFALLEPTGFNWETNNPFLEIEVDGTVLAPREELAASAYAMNSWQVSGKKYSTAASAPSSPGAGDLWYDTAQAVLKYYDGAGWVASGASAYAKVAATQTFSGQNTFTNRVTVSTELYLSEGYITFGNSGAPPPARGRVYFDSTGQGAFKISLDGATWVALSTGGTGGALTVVTADAAAFSGNGSAGTPLALKASSVTLQGNTFNAADRLVRLDATGRYPALDGSLIASLPADTTKLSRAGGSMSGDLQVGDATASTISAAGFLTLAGLGSAPAAAAGRLYFDSSAGKLRVHTGAGFADIATGTIVALGAGTAMLAGDQTFTGANAFRQSLTLSTPTAATLGVPGVDSPLLALRGQAWDSASLNSAQRQMYLRTRVTNENAWKLVADRGGADLWSLDQSGNVASLSSVAASGFFGNGAGLTGIPDASLIGLSASKLAGNVPAGNLGNAVLKAGDAMTGQLTVAGSTVTVSGQDAAGYSLKLSSGISMPAGTVTAGLFVGNGSGLTNVPIAAGTVQDASIVALTASKLSGNVPAGNLGNAVLKAGDSMAGQLTVAGSTVTITGQDAAGYSLKLSSGLTTPAGTVTAGLFVGNGAGLTGLPDASITGLSAAKLAGNVPAANLGNAVLKTGDSMSGMLYMESAGTHLMTLTQPGVSVGTHVVLTGNLDVTGGVLLRQAALPPVPPAGQSKLVMDSGSGKVKLSENGGPFVNLIGGAGGAVTLQSTTPGISDTGNLNLSGTGLFSALGVGANLPSARIEARANGADSYTLRLGTGATSYQVVATTSGFLGVGTPAPQAALDLYGQQGQDLLRVRDPYSGSGYLVAAYTAQDAAVFGAYRAGWRPLTISGSPVSFPNGSVGIGTTNPGARLHVSAPTAVPGDTVFAVSTNAAPGSEVFVAMGDGKIGIGINAPAHPLHVASYSLGRPSILLDNRSAGASISSALRFGKNGSDKWAILTDASQANIQDLAIYDAVQGAYRLYISSEGNVSIDGPTSPQAKLDINGTVVIRSLPPTPATAPAGLAKLWYDSSTNKLKLSENGGAYTSVVGGVANAVTLQPTTPGVQDTGHFNVLGHGIIQQGLDISSAAATAANTLLSVARNPVTGANELLVVKGDGLTGIGTASPARRLHVAGTDGMRLNASAAPGTPAAGDIVVDSGDSNKLKWHDGTAWRLAGGGWNDLGTVIQMQTASDNVLIQSTLTVAGDAFSVGGSTVVVASGKVGIGTTGPGAKLDITPPASTDILLNVHQQKNDGGSADVTTITDDRGFGGVNSGNSLRIIAYNTGGDDTGAALNIVDQSLNPIFVTKLSGNVGIGTASPAAKLHVSSGTVLIDGNAPTAFRVGQSTFAVASSGNVGIGIAAPRTALDAGAKTDGMIMPTGTTAERPATLVTGTMRYNTTLARPEYYNGTTWIGILNPAAPAVATGGEITEVGGYRIHTFKTSGTFTVVSNITAEVLVVGGGGGGGAYSTTNANGGGGAGGVVYAVNQALTPAAYTVTIGRGGSGYPYNTNNTGGNGSNSVFGALTAAIGGGGGSGQGTGAGQAGGSGGGCSQAFAGGAATQGGGGGNITVYGNAGGNGSYTWTGCGGGGAGSAGVGGNVCAGCAPSGNGGNGVTISISGSAVCYAGGGGGGGNSSERSGKGFCGGGRGFGSTNYGDATGDTYQNYPCSLDPITAGNRCVDGIANTGGGGGASSYWSSNVFDYHAGSGGSGVVIVRYQIP